MNRDEAKFILTGVRPNGADADDPALEAARQLAAKDPDLQRWWQDQQMFDTAVAGKLAQIEPPVGLRAAILAGGHMTSRAQAERRGWFRPLLWAIAASVAISLAGGLALWPRQARGFEEWAYQDSQLREADGHGSRGNVAHSLQSTLSRSGVRLGSAIPVDFAELKKQGCRVVRFAGHEVLEVCFNRDGEWFHCYIARAADFPTTEFAKGAAIIDKGGTSLATWTDGANLFVVVSKQGRRALDVLL